MNQSKIIKKAEEVSEIKINEPIVEVSFEDFCKFPGKKFKCNGEIFVRYKKCWYKSKIGNSGAEKQNKSDTEINNIQIIEWCGKLKNYVDDELLTIKKDLSEMKKAISNLLKLQEEYAKEFKTYVDNKVREHIPG
jgi:hypothetical protein